MPKPFEIDFTTCSNITTLAACMGCPEEILKSHISTDKKFLFIPHQIPKKGRGQFLKFRTVWEPYHSNVYKAFTRRFDLFLRLRLSEYPHNSSYGYIRGRSTYENAQQHLGASLILKADIKNFFTSIAQNRLRSEFIKIGIQPDVADILSEFTTINGCLQAGIHSSPMLANLCCLELDKEFHEISKRLECTYTRYADDITFSGNTLPSKQDIETILNEEGFNISERKFRIIKQGQAQFVTGLSITDTKAPHVPKKLKRKLRQELYYCEKYGILEHLEKVHDDRTIQQGINRLDGIVRYISHIERDKKTSIRAKWDSLMKRDNVSPSYKNLNKHKFKHAVIYADEALIEHKGQKYLAICFAQTLNFREIEYTSFKKYIEYIEDPFSAGRKKKIIKNKIHFTDAHDDLKKIYIDTLVHFPFDGYIAFQKIENEKNYRSEYINLVKNLITYRLKSLDSATVDFLFEENSQISSLQLKNTIIGEQEKLRNNNDRHPYEVRVRTVSKDEFFGSSLPDFLLGLFSKYCNTTYNNPIPRNILLFEKVRDKVRVIYDADYGIHYTRKRAFTSITPPL